MFNIGFFLRRLLAFPIGLVTSPGEFFKEKFNDSAQSRALLLGLPAVVIAATGVSAIVWTAFVSRESLEGRYVLLAENCENERIELMNELRTDSRSNDVAEDQTGMSGDKGIPVEDERVQKIYRLRDARLVYLEKLISLDSQNDDYRYRLALIAGQKGDMEKCRALMKSVAGDEIPGNPRAHLWRAHDLMRRRVRTRSELIKYLTAALQQVKLCLVRDTGNLDARFIKAQLLSKTGRYREARTDFEELFEKYPRFYQQIVELNGLLEETNNNANFIDAAEKRFLDRISDSSREYDPSWSLNWSNYVKCLYFQKKYSVAVEKLSDAELVQSRMAKRGDSPEASSRHVFVKQLLTTSYTRWADSIGQAGEISIDQERQQLGLLKKALQYDLQNATALKLIARISAGDTELAAEAKSIYDPEEFQDDAPPAVLNEIGSRALIARDYEKAIRYFEWAKKKSPNEPMILNNLAWTYLVCENQNPDRALTLVDQAIVRLQKISDREQRGELASHFFDTRGKALLQMDRKTEAATAFERALEWRPENTKIIKSLIQCYQGSDDRQVQVLQLKLTDIESRNGSEPDDEDGPGTIDLPVGNPG